METRIDEIGDGIFRLSTFVAEIAAPAGFTFNQFLIMADEPLLYHTGPRGMFASVSAALGGMIPVEKLRWISFGHVEADECGAMNMWLAAAPQARVVYSPMGADISVKDLADRPPFVLAEGESLDLGGRRIRLIATPHVPHGWEAQALYEEVTNTLFCGDLLTHFGASEPITESDIVDAAMASEDRFGATSIGPYTAPAIRKLASLGPTTLAVMHGASFRGDGGEVLNRLADRYEEKVRALMA